MCASVHLCRYVCTNMWEGNKGLEGVGEGRTRMRVLGKKLNLSGSKFLPSRDERRKQIAHHSVPKLAVAIVGNF